MYVGARPAFADADSATWNISPEEIEKKYYRKDKGDHPCPPLWQSMRYGRVSARLQWKYSLYVIEDATESLGATYKNRHTGVFGDLGIFSFNGNKTSLQAAAEWWLAMMKKGWSI